MYETTQCGSINVLNQSRTQTVWHWTNWTGSSTPLRSAPYLYSVLIQSTIYDKSHTGCVRWCASRKLPRDASRWDQRHTCAVAKGAKWFRFLEISSRRDASTLRNPDACLIVFSSRLSTCRLLPFETFIPMSFWHIKFVIRIFYLFWPL